MKILKAIAALMMGTMVCQMAKGSRDTSEQAQAMQAMTEALQKYGCELRLTVQPDYFFIPRVNMTAAQHGAATDLSEQMRHLQNRIVRLRPEPGGYTPVMTTNNMQGAIDDTQKNGLTLNPGVLPSYTSVLVRIVLGSAQATQNASISRYRCPSQGEAMQYVISRTPSGRGAQPGERPGITMLIDTLSNLVTAMVTVYTTQKPSEILETPEYESLTAIATEVINRSADQLKLPKFKNLVPKIWRCLEEQAKLVSMSERDITAREAQLIKVETTQDELILDLWSKPDTAPPCDAVTPQ
ncbi:MAG: hypothetical protein LBJ69_00045 [Holosporales bacterium]|nr:hypothetical protein [Holosporales bacterium]